MWRRFAAFDHHVGGLHPRVLSSRRRPRSLPDRRRTQNAAAGSANDRVTLEPDPNSRLADPTNPDRPPRPPDDPVAARYMSRPNGMKGASGRRSISTGSNRPVGSRACHGERAARSSSTPRRRSNSRCCTAANIRPRSRTSTSRCLR